MEEAERSYETATDSRRPGLLTAGAVALVCLAAGTAAILFLGSGTPVKHQYTAAPDECVGAWNGNLPARYLGRHQYGFHRYKDVEIVMLSADGSRKMAPGSAGARCAIVFAASSLDPEFAAAAVIKRPAAWFPLSQTASANRLAELQSEAKTAYNANLHADGTVTSLPPP
jgi:hypothetical protein